MLHPRWPEALARTITKHDIVVEEQPAIDAKHDHLDRPVVVDLLDHSWRLLRWEFPIGTSGVIVYDNSSDTWFIC